jgi:hypothetical protein
VQNGGRPPGREVRLLDVYNERPVRVSAKVLVPVKEHPKVINGKPLPCSTLIKKKIHFFSYISKYRRERLQSLILLTASSNMTKYLRFSSYILGSPSSYMTLQLNFLIYEEIFNVLFYQCMVLSV